MNNSAGNLNAFKEKARLYAKAYDASGLALRLRHESKGEMEPILAQADALMNNTFTYTDRWDMEPCSLPYQISPLEWEHSPNGDPEWVYMLNRHEYLKKLLLAGWCTGSSSYFQKAKEFILHWISHNTVGPEATLATRTIDTGIRCANWLPVLVHLTAMDLLTDEEIQTIIQSIHQQIRYLNDSYVPKYTLSNWGVLQTSAILLNSLWLKDFLDPEITAWAGRELEEQLHFQIYEDGSHWEQSIMYHIEVLNCVSTFLIMAKQLDELFPPKTAEERWDVRWKGISQVLLSMYRYVQTAAGPDHIQPAQGDSDCTDVRDVLSRGALLFGDGSLKAGGYQTLDLDNLWFFGMAGISAYEKLPAKDFQTLEGIYPHSGNYFFRTSWEENANYTYLHNGPLGSSHGHVDFGHLSNYYKGKAFLVDCGRYSYVEEDPLREILKNQESHNVCCIKGASSGKAHGSWSYSFFGDSLKNYEKTMEGIHYLEMPFLSKEPEGSLAFHNRRVFILPEGVWLISDDLRMDGQQESFCRFHFDPKVVPVKEIQDGAKEILLENQGVSLILGSDQPLSCSQEILSRRYNATENHFVFTSRLSWKNEGHMISWLIPEHGEIKDTQVFQAEASSPCPPSQVAAKEIWLEGQLKYIILIFPHEIFKGRKIFTCHGANCQGKAIVLKKEGETFRQLRFRA